MVTPDIQVHLDIQGSLVFLESQDTQVQVVLADLAASLAIQAYRDSQAVPVYRESAVIPVRLDILASVDHQAFLVFPACQVTQASADYLDILV